jgi:hypothetical protein
MKYHTQSLLTLAAGLGIVSALALTPASALQQPLQQQQQELPPGHPPIELPTGHPPINDGRPAGHPTLGGGHPGGAMQDGPKYIEADPDDVTTIDQIITAYYDTVSGEPGAKRDWNRFRSLFIPEARLIAAQAAGPNQPCIVLTTEQFINFNASYFERGGYVEQDIHRIAERFGNAAHVFSTYEARRAEADPEPYSRGVNSMQLVHDGTRWWIANVMWDFERPDNPIPQQYLATQTVNEEP